MLRTNLEFTTLDCEATTIMVTSATAGEGKSTTTANLAVALARAGKRVTVVDLDLRQPGISRLFAARNTPESPTSCARERRWMGRCTWF